MFYTVIDAEMEVLIR